MMNEYKTSQIAKAVGIHPNTVRLYENIEFIPKPYRKSNGYRVFTDVHLEQIKLARMALKAEVLQNGLRKEAIEIIKIAASGDYEAAIEKTENYMKHLKKEYKNAREAIFTVNALIAGEEVENSTLRLTRKEAADYLEITIDTIRNWERNGLVSIPRGANGFGIYTVREIRILKIIRTLRCANYSLMAILRMLRAVSADASVNLMKVIDTPTEIEDIVSACDRLLTCLKNAEEYGALMLLQLKKMKKMFT